ncbi:MAG: rhomboid family intramembrane serine protease [Planctomycetota bacterium]
MLIPYSTDVPQDRQPIANWLLVGATVLISAAAIVSDQLDMANPLLLQRHAFSIPQLFTSLFLHDGFVHLLGNMVFLFCFGNAVNAKLGHALFVLAYLLLGALAGLAWLLMDTGTAALGASGAIMGIVGMYLVFYPRNDVAVFYFFWLFYFVRTGVFTVSSYWIILLYLLFDAWGLLLGDGGVAYVAHLAGAVAGIGAAVACS